MINSKIILGFIIHTVISLLMFLDTDHQVLGIILLPFVLANLIGILLIAAGKNKTGAMVFLISSAFYVPIGLIGVMGARKIIDEEKLKNFNNNNK